MKIYVNRLRDSIFGFFPFLYPTIEGMFSLISNGEYLNTFRIGSISLLLLIWMLFYVQKRKYILIFIVFLMVTFFEGIKFSLSSELLIFTLFTLLLMTYSDERLSHLISLQMKTKSRQIDACFLLYLLMVILSIVLGKGFYYHWGTITIMGPYSIPHIVAYGFTGWSLYYFIKVINFLPHFHFSEIASALISLIFLLLTGTRSALLALMIFVLLIFLRLGWRKQIVIFLGIGIGLIVLLEFTDFATAILEKTNYAINNGSISNGRLSIWNNSIQALHDYNFLDLLLGRGMDFLTFYNLQHIGMSIQAHNDIITVLLCYGFVGIIMYFYAIYSFMRRSPLRAEITVVLFVLAVSNGLFTYVPFVCFMTSISNLSITDGHKTSKDKLYMEKYMTR